MYKRQGHLSRSMPVPLDCLNCYSHPFQLEFTLALTETLKVICNLLWDIDCSSVKLFPLHGTDPQVQPVWSNTVRVSSLILFPLESPVSRPQMISDSLASAALCHLTSNTTPQHLHFRHPYPPPPPSTATYYFEKVCLTKNIKLKTISLEVLCWMSNLHYFIVFPFAKWTHTVKLNGYLIGWATFEVTLWEILFYIHPPTSLKEKH